MHIEDQWLWRWASKLFFSQTANEINNMLNLFNYLLLEGVISSIWSLLQQTIDKKEFIYENYYMEGAPFSAMTT